VISFKRASVLLALSAALAATPAVAQQSSAEGVIQRATLDNGLRIIVVENHAVPLATVLVAVRDGAMTQEPQDQGLTHLYEHLLFRSYEGDPEAFASDATHLKAEYNGFTDEEVVAYYVVLPSENTLKGLDLLAKMLEHPRFKDRDLQEERPVVLDELQRSESDPEQALARQAAQLLWGTSWSRRDPGGDSASLQGITLEHLQDAYERYYVPNNAALIVTGDVSAASVMAAATKSFGSWPRGIDPFQEQPLPPIAVLKAARARLMAKPVAYSTILVQFQGPGVADDTAATYAADALCDVLNAPGSAFQRRLVEGGKFQSVHCSYQTLNHVGPITIEGQTGPRATIASLNILLAELDRLDQLQGLTAEDLTIASRRRAVQTALTLESTATLAPTLAFWWASGGIDYYESYDARMNVQTLDDLRGFAREYIVSRPHVIAVLSTQPVIERLQAMLGVSPKIP
jgi:zinc protease